MNSDMVEFRKTMRLVGKWVGKTDSPNSASTVRHLYVVDTKLNRRMVRLSRRVNK